MGYGRHYGLGFVTINSGMVNRALTESGFAKQPRVLPEKPTPIATVQKRPNVSRHVPIKSPPLRMPDDFIGHDESIASRYTPEQIREMLERGASETVERSGESDGGGPADDELMQQSREANATDTFVENGNGTGTTPAGKTVKDFLPLGLIVAGAMYFLV